MFRTVGDQPSLWESVLPEELRRLPEELARVDALLDDPAFFAPFVPFFDPRIGSAVDADGDLSAVDVLEVPLPAGLRVAVPGGVGLDHLAAVLPDPAGRAGAASDDADEADHPVRDGGGGRAERGAVGQGGRGEAVAHQPGAGRHHGGAGERGLSRPTPGCWPRRCGGSRRPVSGSRPPVARSAPRCGTGPARRASARTRSRRNCAPAPPRAATRPGRGAARAPVSWPIWPRPRPAMPNGCWPTPNGRCAGPRPRPPNCAPRCARRGGGPAAWPAGPCGQRPDRSCWPRPARSSRRPGSGWPGTTPDGATRRVSLHDPDARPIAKGRLGKPVEFGHKAQVVDNDDGIVLDHNVEPGNPADAPQLAPAVERVIRRTGRTPGTVTADRGYGESQRRRRPARPRRPHRRDPPQRQTRQGPTSRGTPTQRSDEP